MLEHVFKKLSAAYTDDEQLVNDSWIEIAKAYNQPGRYYHNLLHLEHLYNALLGVKERIDHWDETIFSLFYHDIVYNPLKNNNEEKSAEKALQVMKQLGVSTAIIDFTFQQIVATKKHELHAEAAINYFTDADLAILGEAWPVYEAYYLNVRKEYSMYPDLLYKPGRKKVLEHFLSMSHIYKTTFFHEGYEKNARLNLQRELDFLTR